MDSHGNLVEEHASRAPGVGCAQVGWVALGITVTLNVASMAVPASIDHPLTTNRGPIQVYLDVFEEGNLPTWWSVALLSTAALAHGATGALARAGRARAAWAWFVTAGVLALLSLDDHTQLHERLLLIGKQWITFDGFPFYWVLPGLLAGTVVATALLALAVRLTGTERWCMIGGCVLLLGSALGIETLQGLLIAADESGPLYVLTYHVEELGENLGALLLLAAAIRSVTITRQEKTLRIHYGRDRGQ